MHLLHLVQSWQRGGVQLLQSGLEQLAHSVHLSHLGYSQLLQRGLVHLSHLVQLQSGGLQLLHDPWHLAHEAQAQWLLGSRWQKPSCTHSRHWSQLGPPHLLHHLLGERHFLHCPSIQDSHCLPVVSESSRYLPQMASAFTLHCPQSSHIGGVHLVHKGLMQFLHFLHVEQSLMSISEQKSGTASGKHSRQTLHSNPPHRLQLGLSHALHLLQVAQLDAKSYSAQLPSRLAAHSRHLSQLTPPQRLQLGTVHLLQELHVLQ
mmetsp:Transcript_36881/g.80327  ORF Transcript_36881/g.80327 Transcript_36881/m.80327 type:complete len:261 (+) Transcript_36881:226-1008(+)